MKLISNLSDWARRALHSSLNSSEATELTAVITALKDEFSALKSQCSTIHNEFSVLKSQCSTIHNELSVLKSRNSTLHDELLSVKAEQAKEKANQEQAKKEQEQAAKAVAKEKPRAGLGTDRSAVIRFNKEFLHKHYDLRYNELKRATEFRQKAAAATVGGQTADHVPPATASGGFAAGTASAATASGGFAAGTVSPAWRPLTDRDLNQMTVEQLEAGGGSWSYAMRLCIERSAVPAYNPVHTWLADLPQWDGHDHITDLAARVPTSYSRWPEFFHRWMLAVVAQAVSGSSLQVSGSGFQVSHGNSMVPMLIGGQGLRKTTFCRSLLPPELREYFMDDIKMDSAEQVERVLARMWLVCIDEYNAKTPREQAKIKRLLTEKDVQVRRPRSDEYRLLPRLCSFIATTNDPTPLPSGDGTRRYLCINVEGMIDTDTPVDYGQVYAQAMHELQEGQCYWFTADDEAEIQRHNMPFQQASPIETVLPSLFEPTTERRRENLWQVQKVQKVLAEHLRKADIPNLRQLSDAMKALGWPQGAAQGTRGYYLKLKATASTSW
ncbi:MAG: hypothetical protein IJT98_00725 [Prevotella sp.]|nr:hypothetical protein [Prevotella sp.]